MKNTLFLLFLALIATSCASIDYSTNYDQKTKVEIKKIAIISEAVKQEGFVDFFSKELALQAKRNKFEVLSIFKDSLSFTTSAEIAQNIEKFNPDVVIELRRIESANNLVYNRYGRYIVVGGTYYLGVKKNGENTIYWKSIINVGDEGRISNTWTDDRGNVQGKPYIDLVGKRATEILAKIIKDSNNQ